MAQNIKKHIIGNREFYQIEILNWTRHITWTEQCEQCVMRISTQLIKSEWSCYNMACSF